VLPPSPGLIASLNATSPADQLPYLPLCQESLLPLKRLIGRRTQRPKISIVFQLVNFLFLMAVNS